MKIDWFLVARDVLGILVLLFVVMAGTLTTVQITFTTAVTLAFFCLTAGFCVAGCLKREGRFAHLAVVAAGVWITASLVNSATRGLPVETWLRLAAGALLPVAGAMLLGAALSLIFVKSSPPEEPPLDSRPT
ncbi:MAG: hypothetical protein QNK04_20610 [Myxococcota bacterium]|nr:hypothetical protein [Myxococcota bacterium]